MLAGDFNDIMSATEQQGGGMVSENKCKKFRDNIDKCQLIDMGSEGPRFTWRGPITKFANRLYKKLDRGLCNRAWRNEFAEAFIRVGPRFNSDHIPLLIWLEVDRKVGVNRPFRFEAMWIKHARFKPFLKDHWRKGREVEENLREITPKLQQWNLEVFGHVKKRKNSLLRRLEGIQRALQQTENLFLETLEVQLRAELEEVLRDEEILWFQKARTQWLHDGDRNTSYYHTKTNIRRRKNRVKSLKNNDNSWVDSEEEVKAMVNRFFKGLFQEEEEARLWDMTTPGLW